jgi:hypothetical protein
VYRTNQSFINFNDIRLEQCGLKYIT